MVRCDQNHRFLKRIVVVVGITLAVGIAVAVGIVVVGIVVVVCGEKERKREKRERRKHGQIYVCRLKYFDGNIQFMRCGEPNI